MADSFLLSLLARQLTLLGDRFAKRYPHAWLVWEPSEHVRPASVEEADVGATRMPTSVVRRRPAGADAVCFQLPPDGLVTVGRATTNGIAIDDMSMSRNHFLLFVEREIWHLSLAEPVTCGTTVRRMSVEAKKPVYLVDGCGIVAGDVELTFYEQGGLMARLHEELKRQERG